MNPDSAKNYYSFYVQDVYVGFVNILEEKKGNIEITFSSDYSKNVKGDQLFELVNRLFTRPRFKQIDNKIAIVLPKGDQWLNRLNELISMLS